MKRSWSVLLLSYLSRSPEAAVFPLSQLPLNKPLMAPVARTVGPANPITSPGPSILMMVTIAPQCFISRSTHCLPL